MFSTLILGTKVPQSFFTQTVGLLGQVISIIIYIIFNFFFFRFFYYP
jgi:hypothetical protein